MWRVGYGPDPWKWTDWAHASDGRFGGRWDAIDGSYRTIYAGSTLTGCLMEVLARFRPDAALVGEMTEIVVEATDRDLYETVPAGVVDRSWFDRRRVGSAMLAGRYCDVASSASIAALRPMFLGQAVGEFGLADFDAAALQDSRPRVLTQRVARAVYLMDARSGGPYDGIRFLSRHGNDAELWAVYERSTDVDRSAQLASVVVGRLDAGSPEVREALDLFGLVVN
ncbi:RES family NAD+ phosphorylase [Plantibacter sp. Mn2098]|uniref:RES family NAD+ phosphorylase n=1 Tax=Plantibacter sp. Mn2098 TaxID=3395266 RepID=UPI003BCB8847